MINPLLYKYTVVIMTEDQAQYDISGYIENVSWEEADGELAARLSFTAKNDKTSKGRISDLAKPGCWIGYLYSYNGGKNEEAVRGKIEEWNPSAKNSSAQFRVKAYDILRDLQESHDYVYFSSGHRTKSMVTNLLTRWGLTVGTYSGPDVSHGKILYKNEKLGTAVIKLLQEAKKKGGKEAVLRAEKNKISVLAYGSNSTVYHFEENVHITDINHKISTSGMVTRVKVIGKQDDDGCAPVEATVNGSTKYGIRQRIYSRGSDETLSEAKKSAQEILEEDGKPKDDITITLPDMPVIRKGDRINVKTSTLGTGDYFVISATHNVDKMTMSLSLRSAGKTKTLDNAASGKKKSSYSVGDIVTFNGGTHYVSSYEDSKGYSVSAGKAKIEKINTSKSSLVAHPYLLVTRDWSKSHVCGWVDEGSFS